MQELAGATCRQKKVKCSGTGPPCGHCVEYGETCHYDDSGHNPSVKTLEEFQARIARLEDYITATGGKLPLLHDRLSISMPALPAPPPSASSSSTSAVLPWNHGLLADTSDSGTGSMSAIVKSNIRPLRPIYSPKSVKSGSTSSLVEPLFMNDLQAEESISNCTESSQYTSPLVANTSCGREDEIMEDTARSDAQQLRPDKRGNLRYLGEHKPCAIFPA